jgi:hypothetical protein
MFTFCVSGRKRKNTPPFSHEPAAHNEKGVFSMVMEAEVVEEEERMAE